MLIGHSLGAAISIIIAAQHGKSLPLLGVSALGIIPKKRLNVDVFGALKNDSGTGRIRRPEVPSEQDLRSFLGAPEFFDISKLPTTEPVWEDGK